MMAESKEYADKLEIALTGDPGIFLEQEVPDDVNNPKSMLSQQKAVLVNAIKKKVRLSSQNYQNLLDYFYSEKRVCGDIVNILERAYKDRSSTEDGKAAWG